MAIDSPRLRLGIVGIIALSLFAALLTRLWYLQVLSAPEFRLQAAANSIRVVPEPAPRGRILDRQGRIIVDNRASNVVAIDRAKFATEIGLSSWSAEGWNALAKTKRAKALEPLATVLAQPVDVLEHRLLDLRTSPYTPIPVATDVTEDKMVRLLEHSDAFPSVVAKRVAVRSYPMGNLAPHILGYVGQASESEIAASAHTLRLGDEVGKAGVEYAYDRELRGTPGEERIEVDAQGKPIRVVSRKAPVQGLDIVLSIDADVQRVAEDSLKQGLEAAHGQRFQDNRKPLIADAGAAVVLDTHGGVIALASYPTFDLPSLADGVSEEEGKQLFSDASGAPFVDRAIEGRYAPGSTWKLVTADAALRSHLIAPGSTVNDTGVYKIGGDCTVGCTVRNAGSTPWGIVNVTRALSVSSDYFFYDLGARFWFQRRQYGDDVIQKQAEQYGFGQRTGIPLPYENPGLVLTPALKREYAASPDSSKRRQVDGPDWFAGTNVNLAIGQGAMFVTPIQIANAYATFANGGDRYQPNIALRVQRQDKSLVREISARKAGHVDLPPALRDPILAGLRGAINDEKGTAHNAFLGFPVAQWGVAGKTGTAQAPPKQDTALFVGFGPVAQPQYAVAVVMEQSGFGASAAAPVARRLFGQLSGLEQSGQPTYTQVNGAGD
jgi:penicillin-binding protein 2